MTATFTKESLEFPAAFLVSNNEDDLKETVVNLAAHALAQTEAREKAEAEVERLAKELADWKAKSDRHESERDSFRMTSDRLRIELFEAEEALVGFASWFITKTVTCSEPDCPACKAMASPAVRRARKRQEAPK